MKIYLIQELVSNEASGAYFCNSTVVVNNEEKAKKVFDEYVSFYKNKEYYVEKFVNDSTAEFASGGVEFVKIKFSCQQAESGVADFSI